MKTIDKNYCVYKNGGIFSKRKNIFLRPNVVRGGYLQVKLGSKMYLVHRLVALTFLQNDYGYKYVNHKNGIKSDNRLKNLEWCSHSYNIKHAYKTGLMSNKCDSARNKKLSSTLIKKIRRLYSTGDFRQKDLANMFKVHQTNISLIITNKHWAI